MMMPMPPVGFYPPPPPPRGGFVRAIFITLATTIFGLSLVLNIYLLAWTGLTGGEVGTKSTILVSGDPKQKVAVIPIDDIIDTELARRFEKALKQVESDPTVKALVLEIDTPGGTVTASDEIYNSLMKFKAERRIPIVAAMGSMATSGGYYVACASDEIVAQPTTVTGNIGVVLQRFNLSGTLEKLGARETSITPEGADFKNIESPFRPESPEVAEYLRGITNDLHGRFKTIVATSREGKLKDSIDKIADGKIYIASEASKLGLIDQLGYSRDAHARAAALASLSNHTVVRYEHQPTLFESFALRSTIKPGGPIHINLDPSRINELVTPRAMYLWRGE